MNKLPRKEKVELINAINEQYPLISIRCHSVTDRVWVSPIWDIENLTNGEYKGEHLFRVEIPTDLVIDNGLVVCLVSGAKKYTSGQRAIRCLTLLKIIEGEFPTKVFTLTDLVEAGYMFPFED
jgi:hypothetical protein